MTETTGLTVGMEEVSTMTHRCDDTAYVVLTGFGGDSADRRSKTGALIGRRAADKRLVRGLPAALTTAEIKALPYYPLVGIWEEPAPMRAVEVAEYLVSLDDKQRELMEFDEAATWMGDCDDCDAALDFIFS